MAQLLVPRGHRTPQHQRASPHSFITGSFAADSLGRMDSMSELAIATGDALEQELQGGIDVLQANLAELENSIYHLVRSNVELAQVCLKIVDT